MPVRLSYQPQGANLTTPFYVAAGAITIATDGSEETVGAGGFFYGPRDRTHGFRNAGNEVAKLLVFITPGSNIERMFGRLAALTERAGANIKPADVAAICAEHNISFS
jgi:glyoxylate utilization-related uncharacterized protein